MTRYAFDKYIPGYQQRFSDVVDCWNERAVMSVKEVPGNSQGDKEQKRGNSENNTPVPSIIQWAFVAVLLIFYLTRVHVFPERCKSTVHVLLGHWINSVKPFGINEQSDVETKPIQVDPVMWLTLGWIRLYAIIVV